MPIPAASRSGGSRIPEYAGVRRFRRCEPATICASLPHPALAIGGRTLLDPPSTRSEVRQSAGCGKGIGRLANPFAMPLVRPASRSTTEIGGASTSDDRRRPRSGRYVRRSTWSPRAPPADSRRLNRRPGLRGTTRRSLPSDDVNRVLGSTPAAAMPFGNDVPDMTVRASTLRDLVDLPGPQRPVDVDAARRRTT